MSPSATGSGRVPAAALRLAVVADTGGVLGRASTRAVETRQNGAPAPVAVPTWNDATAVPTVAAANANFAIFIDKFLVPLNRGIRTPWERQSLELLRFGADLPCAMPRMQRTAPWLVTSWRRVAIPFWKSLSSRAITDSTRPYPVGRIAAGM